MKKRVNALLTLILLMMMTIILASPNLMVKSILNTNLKVQPQENTFCTNTTSVGHPFVVSIIAENIPSDNKMFGWEFILNWTPGLINCTLETINYGYWPAYLGPWIPYPIDNIKGEYHQSLTGRTPSTPVSGTYWLVNLTFQIVQAPVKGGTLISNLTLQHAPGYTAYCLVNSDGDEIPHAYTHGIYKYISPREELEEIALSVSPSAIMNPSLIPGETFEVNITAAEAAYLHGFSLGLAYNATIIECTDVQEGDLLQGFGTTTMAYSIDNIAGETLASVNLTAPEAEASGSGILVKLTFQVKDTGDSSIHFFDVFLYDHLLAPLIYTTNDGYFNNVLMPVIYVYPPVIIDPSMKPSDEFQITINVANVSNLYDFEFTLLYDTKVLNGLGLIVYPFKNSTFFDLEFSLNDPQGRIWVKVQYYPPAEPLTAIDPVTLVKIFFQIQSYGGTPLDLTDTSLSDYYGNLMTHIAKDGFVSNLRRDVAIIEIKSEYNEIYKGWVDKINVTAKNLGDIAETFNVTLFCNNNKIGEQQINGLAPNATKVLTFQFSTLQDWLKPCHNYTLSAKASQLPYELNVTNNQLIDGQIHIKLMGDINGDTYVNATDAIIIGWAFGSRLGDPRWNPNADLNQDGYINAKDVIILGINFGAHCMP